MRLTVFRRLRPTKPHSLRQFSTEWSEICNPLKDLPCNQYDRRRSRPRPTRNRPRPKTTNPRTCRSPTAPPTSKSRQIRIAYPSIEYSFFALRYARIMTGEVSPVTPLKEVCNKDDRRRTRPRPTRNSPRPNATNPRSRRRSNTRRRAKLYRSTNNKHNPQNKSRTIRL